MKHSSNDEPHLSWKGRGRFYSEQILPVELTPLKTKSLNPGDSENMIIEGDNLSVMSALLGGSYRLRNQVDLLLWDPPYNTGSKDFRYRDDYALNKQEVARLEREGQFKSGAENGWVSINDPTRHTKWLNFMAIRLWYGRKLLRESGVIAVCIDYNELFRLGMLMDEIFGGNNRLGIINWQRRFSPSNDSRHLSPTTEYVLVYAKNSSVATTGMLERTESMNSRYKNPDEDPLGEWTSGDPSVKTYSEKDDYGIQNPFTGEVQYPPTSSSWRFPQKQMKEWLEDWGIKYSIRSDPDRPDQTAKSLMIKGSLSAAKSTVMKRFKEGSWPRIFFLKQGKGRLRFKRYLNDVKQGRVPCTFFNEEESYGEPFSLGSQSWVHSESGNTNKARKLLNSVVGAGHKFDTAKPLELMEKIIQLWCPADGIVLDAFAGSGTTAHAVLDLNHNTGANRRFILIECGQGDDKFCDTLTADRVRRVITGKWKDGKKHDKIDDGFTYLRAGRRLGKDAIMEAQREELADIILQSARDSSGLVDCRVEEPGLEFIIGKTRKNEGIALVWGDHGSILEKRYGKLIRAEAKKLGLKTPLQIYATVNKGPNGAAWYSFCAIPDSILTALGIAKQESRRDG